MNAPFSRRWALALARWAAWLLPPGHASWGNAMRCEVEHINDDRAALRWAAGALCAAGVERSGATLSTRWAGCGMALIIFLQALNMFFAPVLIIAWHLHWLPMDEFLGGQLPGDHYQRFVPLMNATSVWQTALWITVGLLFLAVAWRLLRNHHGAFSIFATALLFVYAGACAAWIDRQLHPALAEIYRHVFTFSRPNFRRDYVIPAAQQIAPLLMAAVLWWRETREGLPEP